MTSDTIPVPATLSLAHLNHAGPGSRWRTEAMRSHATSRLILTTKGQGRITVAGLTNGYGPNNLIYIPPQTMYGLEVGPTVFGQVLSFSPQDGWPEKPVHLRLLGVEPQKEAISHFEAIERELKPTGDRRAAVCHFGLLSVFFERQQKGHNSAQQDERRSSAAAQLAERYTAMIARDFGSDRNVADYAAALGVTTAHLTRCCQKTCGRTALELLNERVHYEACVLLSDTRRPIHEIASDLGFQTAAYFTRRFQELSGKSPSAFREFEMARNPQKIV
ncbi:helix-turn-helix domain-containing protein [Yoonia sp.]|uniref:helix-turn-helix domain-containing protein n=1 Tax=Yoonia sp. TaxID=2212373 RepID=UPI002FDB617F